MKLETAKIAHVHLLTSCCASRFSLANGLLMRALGLVLNMHFSFTTPITCKEAVQVLLCPFCNHASPSDMACCSQW